MTTTTKPTLDDITRLYKAAWQQKAEGALAIARVRDCMGRHGFDEADVRRAAGILPPETPQEPPFAAEFDRLLLVATNATFDCGAWQDPPPDYGELHAKCTAAKEALREFVLARGAPRDVNTELKPAPTATP